MPIVGFCPNKKRDPLIKQQCVFTVYRCTCCGTIYKEYPDGTIEIIKKS